MSKFLALTKVLMKNGGNTFWENNKLKGKYSKMISMIIFGLLIFGSVAISFGVVINEMYDALYKIGQQGLIIGFSLPLACLLIFCFGIFYVMNVFYFSMDVENLLPMPLKPSQILGAKFAVSLVYEYFTEAMFLAPMFIIYGVKSSSGILYYIYSIIVFLTLPIIPLIIASIINMIMMRFTNIGKNKDRFKLIGGVLALFLGLGINMFMQKISSKAMKPEMLQEMLEKGDNSIINIYTKVFPSIKPAINGLINNSNLNGFINIMLFIIISIVSIVIFIVLGEKLYFKGVIGISESESKRKKLTEKEFNKSISQNSILKAYVFKELKLLFRTPIYFINCILMNFLWPVFLIIPMLMESESKSIFKDISTRTQNMELWGVIFAGAVALSIFITSTNGITSTAISREGKNLFFTKFIPVDYKKQIEAKILSGAIMGSIGTVMILIVGIIIFKIPNLLLFLILVGSLFGILFNSFTGIIIDLKFPKLNWDNEQKAVKQNFNVVINMIIGVLIAGLLVFIELKFQFSIQIIFAVTLIVFLALDIFLYYIISTKGVRILEEIEG